LTKETQRHFSIQGGWYNKIEQQAGAELCQAQTQVGLAAEAELILMLSSMEAIFHQFEIVSDSTREDLQMFC
jgi:hypothetical protein